MVTVRQRQAACGTPSGASPRGCLRLHSQVREDLLDHRRFQERRDDLQFARKLSVVAVSSWPGV
jgi:hypothetical protein